MELIVKAIDKPKDPEVTLQDLIWPSTALSMATPPPSLTFRQVLVRFPQAPLFPPRGRQENG